MSSASGSSDGPWMTPFHSLCTPKAPNPGQCNLLFPPYRHRILYCHCFHENSFPASNRIVCFTASALIALEDFLNLERQSETCNVGGVLQAERLGEGLFLCCLWKQAPAPPPKKDAKKEPEGPIDLYPATMQVNLLYTQALLVNLARGERLSARKLADAFNHTSTCAPPLTVFETTYNRHQSRRGQCFSNGFFVVQRCITPCLLRKFHI